MSKEKFPDEALVFECIKAYPAGDGPRIGDLVVAIGVGSISIEVEVLDRPRHEHNEWAMFPYELKPLTKYAQTVLDSMKEDL